MKKIFFILALCLFNFSECVASSSPFEVGEKFHRAIAKSPVYIEYSNNIIEKHYGAGKKSGFKIFTITDKNEVGYLIPTYMDKNTAENKPYIDIAFVFIEEPSRKNGYATHALLTLCGVYQKRLNHFPDVENFSLCCAEDNKGMISSATKAGFVEDLNKEVCWSPDFMLSFVRKISRGASSA